MDIKLVVNYIFDLAMSMSCSPINQPSQILRIISYMDNLFPRPEFADQE